MKYKLLLVLTLSPLLAEASTFNALTETTVSSLIIPGGSSLGSPACANTNFFSNSPAVDQSSVTCSASARDPFSNDISRLVADASARVDAGGLHASASMSVADGTPDISTVNSVDAFAQLLDTLIVPGPPNSLGVIDFRFAIDGSFAFGANQDLPNVLASARLTVDLPQSSTSLSVLFPGPLFPTPSSVGANPVDLSFTTPRLPVNLGASNDIALAVRVQAVVRGTMPYEGFIAANFVDTVRIVGVDLFDANGNPIDASGITALSGFDYTGGAASAVPEPPAVVLIALGFVLIGAARGGRRLRAALLRLGPI